MFLFFQQIIEKAAEIASGDSANVSVSVKLYLALLQSSV